MARTPEKKIKKRERETNIKIKVKTFVATFIH